MALPASSSSATWPTIESAWPPASFGMFRFEKPAARDLRRQLVDLGPVDRAALGDPLLDGIDLLLEEAGRALLELADLWRQLGDDHHVHPAEAHRGDGEALGAGDEAVDGHVLVDRVGDAPPVRGRSRAGRRRWRGLRPVG